MVKARMDRQVILYVGGIMVLFLFVLMLLNVKAESHTSDSGAMRVETELRHGLEAVPQAFVDLLGGADLGKMLVELA